MRSHDPLDPQALIPVRLMEKQQLEDGTWVYGGEEMVVSIDGGLDEARPGRLFSCDVAPLREMNNRELDVGPFRNPIVWVRLRGVPNGTPTYEFQGPTWELAVAIIYNVTLGDDGCYPGWLLQWQNGAWIEQPAASVRLKPLIPEQVPEANKHYLVFPLGKTNPEDSTTGVRVYALLSWPVYDPVVFHGFGILNAQNEVVGTIEDGNKFKGDDAFSIAKVGDTIRLGAWEAGYQQRGILNATEQNIDGCKTFLQRTFLGTGFLGLGHPGPSQSVGGPPETASYVATTSDVGSTTGLALHVRHYGVPQGKWTVG